MRTPLRRRFFGRHVRRRYAAVAALSVTLSFSLLVSGCDGDSSTATDSEEVFLQPVAGPGPDPYTPSTVTSTAAPSPEPPAPSSSPGPPARGQMLRTVSGATPGLYGGTQSVASCDVEQQVRFLAADQAKARAFARSAGISQAEIPDFLRGLTPVVLRADTRATSHGYSRGTATSYQSVLQAGTSVLVDQYGAPRVRCAGGNPLKPPVAVKGAVLQTGRSWVGYQPDRVVVIKPTVQMVDSLVIVDIVNNTWIERRSGTDGEKDKRPDVLPPVNPDDIYTYPPPSELTGPGDSPQPGDSTGQSEPVSPPVAPYAPSEPVSPPVAPYAPNEPVSPPIAPDVPSEELSPPVSPDMPSDGGVAPSQPDLFVPTDEPAEPVTFQG
ncbi:DUF6777 domain-containing protein [Streptomyces sp. NPDC019890]|uniref:DUF6777 domain-containing protein n=1 Tax=Streptomyces sp. NPDC019890 TaxID=3365064 RepID=UPI00384BA639